MSRYVQTTQAVRAGMLYITLAALLWAVVESIGPLLADEHHPLEVVWARYAVHLGVLLVLFSPRRGPAALVRTDRLRLQIVRGLLMLLMPICFLAAVSLSDPAEVLSVFWITPLLAMVLATWLLRERVDVWVWPVALGGWAGAVMLVRPDSIAIGLGIIPALGMALCMSLYLVLTRMLRDESTVTNLVFTAACVLVPLSLATPFLASVPTLRAVALMTCIGVLGLGGLYAFDRAADLAPVSVVSPMMYTQPLWVLIIAILFGSEHLGRAGLLGALAVIVACVALLISTGWRLPGTAHGDFPVAPEPAGAQQMRTRL